MMPNKKVSEGKYVGDAYPVTEKARLELQEAILEKYYEADADWPLKKQSTLDML